MTNLHRSTQRNIPIVILIDVEPDEFFIDRSANNSWSGFKLALTTFAEWRVKLSQATGRPVHFSWLVRADPQITESFGSPAWVMQHFGKELAQVGESGDEIGLHVHAYHWSDEIADWVEDYGNQAWVEESVRMGVSAYQQEYGHLPKLFSMGADWINHSTVQLLEQLGIVCDVTVVAGRPSRPFAIHLGTYTGQGPDCSMVRQEPYHPSALDFRLPAPEHQNNGLWILPLANCKYGQSRRQRLSQLLRNPFARKPPDQIEKLYLNTPPNQLREFLEKLVSGSHPRYLPLIVGSRAFADRARYRTILSCLKLLSTYKATSQFSLMTPLETIQYLTEQ